MPAHCAGYGGVSAGRSIEQLREHLAVVGGTALQNESDPGTVTGPAQCPPLRVGFPRHRARGSDGMQGCGIGPDGGYRRTALYPLRRAPLWALRQRARTVRWCAARLGEKGTNPAVPSATFVKRL